MVRMSLKVSSWALAALDCSKGSTYTEPPGGTQHPSGPLGHPRGTGPRGPNPPHRLCGVSPRLILTHVLKPTSILSTCLRSPYCVCNAGPDTWKYSSEGHLCSLLNITFKALPKGGKMRKKCSSFSSAPFSVWALLLPKVKGV